MTDEYLASGLRTWLKDTEARPDDARRSTDKVMTRVDKAGQRGRWWPFPVLNRRAKTATATDTTDYRPSPVPATNGHAPTVIGRTQTMFSPVKAITAGALVFALGGLFLIAQPFDQQGSVPSAATDADAVTDPMAPALVTGSISQTGMSDPGTMSTDEHAATLRYGFVGLAEWEASDPRLSGTETYTGNWQKYAAGFTVEAATRVVENTDGRWVGTVTGLTSPDITTEVVILHGDDAYEGLTAYVVIDHRATALPIEFTAAIFPGEMPPFPEPAE